MTQTKSPTLCKSPTETTTVSVAKHPDEDEDNEDNEDDEDEDELDEEEDDSHESQEGSIHQVNHRSR